MTSTTDSTHPTDPVPPQGGQDIQSTTPAAPSKEPADISSAMEAEMNAAMEQATSQPAEASSDDASADDGHKPAIRGPRVVQGGREYRRGRIVSVGKDDIFIEFGPKELGVLPRTQFKEGDELPKIDEEYEVTIVRFDPNEGLIMCARPGAVQKAEWELLQPGQIVEATVTGTNKGGLELEIAQHRAFMPASQVDIGHVEDLKQFVGQKLKCQVKRVERAGKGNITLSRRDVLSQERREDAKKLQETLKEGDTIEGVVKKIMPFGAFVDMGGIDGLVHISDLSHERVRKVEDVLEEGQKVTCKVLKLDWEGNRHSLGLKQLQDDPFATALSEIEEGAVISGRVTKLADFGAFIEIGPNTEGLAHISELAWRRVEKSSDVLQPDQVVQVKVLKIDKDSRRISLSVKQTQDKPEMPQRGGGGGRGGGGRGRGRGEQDTRSPEEILKETPALRRAREKARQAELAKERDERNKGKKSGGGLGNIPGAGVGLADLKL